MDTWTVAIRIWLLPDSALHAAEVGQVLTKGFEIVLAYFSYEFLVSHGFEPSVSCVEEIQLPLGWLDW